MKEKDFVTIINNSIKAAGGFSYKIPDTPFIPNNPMRFTGKKPFDCISVLYPYAWYIEAKYSNGICGFSDRILREHQKENLLKVYENNDDYGIIKPVVIYACYIPRQIKRIYIFHITRIIDNKITKKQLINDLKYLPIKKTEYMKKVKGQMKLVKEDLFDATKMEESIII